MFQGTRYTMIFVLVTCEDPEVASIMEGRWREGTTVVDELTFRTFFYACNVANTIKYLQIKQKETEDRWSDAQEEF